MLAKFFEYLGYGLLIWLLLLIAGPALKIVKAIGEYFGILISPFLTPIFFIPQSLRVMAICSGTAWLLLIVPLYELLVWFLALNVLTTTAMYLYSGQRKSLEANALHFMAHCYLTQACFDMARHSCETLFWTLMLTSCYMASPAYALRSLARAYTIGAITQRQWKRARHAKKIKKQIDLGKRTSKF